MSHIISVSFANEKVAEKSYRNLKESMKTSPCEVLVLDNHYPLNHHTFIMNLCDELGFTYHTLGENVGCYDGFNYLLSQLPDACEKVIFHGGDHYLLQTNWHIPILDVLSDPLILTCDLSNNVNFKELQDRGYTDQIIFGHKVKISRQVITSSIGGYNVPFLRSTGGITGEHHYYGGNEVKMWGQYNGGKYAVLTDYWEDVPMMKEMQDWQYEEYKILYAHRGLGMSFDEYLATNPQQFGRDVLLKEIFG